MSLSIKEIEDVLINGSRVVQTATLTTFTTGKFEAPGITTCTDGPKTVITVETKVLVDKQTLRKVCELLQIPTKPSAGD